MNKFVTIAVSIALCIVYLLILFVPSFDYLRMIVAFLIVAAFGVVVLLVLRFAVKSHKRVVLNGVGEPYALRTAAQAILVAEDHIVGFPSGTFLVEVGSNSITARELVPKGSGQIVLSFIRVPWMVALGVVGVFAVFGPIGMLIGFVLGIAGMALFLFVFVVPLVLAFLVELAMKPVVKSTIEVVSVTLPDNAVQLDFTFKGPSALLVQKKVLAAFTEPELPERYRSRVAAPATTAATAA